MRQKGTRRSHQGSAYLYVIGVFTVVTLFSTIMLTTLQQTIYQFHTYSLRMQAYYLTVEAADATVAALLQPDPTNATEPTLLEKYAHPTGADFLGRLLYNGCYLPNTATMHHYPGETPATPDPAQEIGTSVITLKREQYPYHGQDKPWLFVTITTTIPDQRGNHTGTFSFEGSVMILLENATVRIYNITP